MKKTILFVAACAALVCSCKKIVPLSEYPFDIEAKAVLFDHCVLDVVPETNDFYYQLAVMTAEEVARYGSEEALVKELDKRAHEDYEEYKEIAPEIEFKSILYRGAYERVFISLQPETEYVGIAYKYNEDMTPDPHPVKLQFKTYPEIESDITFNVSATGSIVTITPSNNDPYIHIYESFKNIKEEWETSLGGFIALAYLQSLEYGIIPGSEESGVQIEDMSDYYVLKVGEQFAFAMCGFNNGMTSEIFAFSVTYNGEDKPGTVEPMEISANTLQNVKLLGRK